jgi:death-on-curing protein
VTRPEPRWLGRLAVDEAHFRVIREHGGAHGLRDENALESALAHPRDRWHYEASPRLSDLAAAYAFGLARNHPFLDGNKRVALVVMVAFLDRNGIELTATNAEAASLMLAVAAGEFAEGELADWIERHARSL